MSKKEGIAYIISNPPGTKHKDIFEKLCKRSIQYARKHLSMPIAVLYNGTPPKLKADHLIDGSSYFKPYTKKNRGELHGLIAAELLKTHIHEWSPFDRTLYIDCDAFVMSSDARHYLDVLHKGFDLSLATCVTMEWKDSIRDTSVRREVFNKAPSYFPYWNFGVFGVAKTSEKILETIRKHFVTYCFGGKNKFGSCPHAQPAVVRAADELSPDHRIFTMPARYNCHFAAAGGYVFSGTPVILHLWKDVRSLMLGMES